MASGGEVENTDPLDRAGQSILRLLQKAGDATDQDRRHIFGDGAEALRKSFVRPRIALPSSRMT